MGHRIHCKGHVGCDHLKSLPLDILHLPRRLVSRDFILPLLSPLIQVPLALASATGS
ncbi:MAG: hypothetical protein USCGTAYLOR_03013 [Chromatiales bacterium USCg_Taylor]|nr:MAG: hypothetical protein USCGTAYLOR_03013 [Chromatiales bacterium USCg_Taylor]